MTAKNGNDLQHFMMTQLQEAQKRFQALEKDAEKALKTLVTRGKESRKDIEKLINKISAGDLPLFDNPKVKQLSKRAEQVGHDMKKRLDELQSRVVEASGMASQAQVKELKGEINRLAKKVEALTKGAAVKPEVRA